MRLHLRFGAPRSNWIPVGLSSQSIAFDEVFSSAPGDPLQGLASAALAAAEGRPGSCVLNAAPEEFVVSFLPAAAGVRLEIVRWPDGKRDAGRGTRVFQATGTPAAVLVPVWRGLRELGGRWNGDARGWRTPFPRAEVARLGALLEG